MMLDELNIIKRINEANFALIITAPKCTGMSHFCLTLPAQYLQQVFESPFDWAERFLKEADELLKRS